MERKIDLVRIRWFFRRFSFGGSLVCLTLAILFTARTSAFIRSAAVAQGKVIELVPEQNQQDGTTNYAAIFSFTALDGKTYTAQAGVATNPPAFKVDQSVRILYHKGNPEDARIDAFWQLWFLPVLLAGVGVFFLGARGLLSLWEQRGKRRVTAAAATS